MAHPELTRKATGEAAVVQSGGYRSVRRGCSGVPLCVWTVVRGGAERRRRMDGRKRFLRLAGKLVTRLAAGNFGNGRNNLGRVAVGRNASLQGQNGTMLFISTRTARSVRDTLWEVKPSRKLSVGVRKDAAAIIGPT
jgi:hypothetical protein